MARKKSPIIISNWKGITTVRSKPPSTKQTANTRTAGQLFGMAANRSKVFRVLLAPIIPESKSRIIINRLQQAFYQWLRTGALQNNNPEDNIQFFEGLSFNKTNELKQRIKVPFSTERLAAGGIKFTVPAFDPVLQVKAPVGTKKLQLKLAAATMEIKDAVGQEFFNTDWLADYVPGMIPAKEIAIPISTYTGKLIIIAISLRYITGKPMTVEELTWEPAGIVGSFFN